MTGVSGSSSEKSRRAKNGGWHVCIFCACIILWGAFYAIMPYCAGGGECISLQKPPGPNSRMALAFSLFASFSWQQQRQQPQSPLARPHSCHHPLGRGRGVPRRNTVPLSCGTKLYEVPLFCETHFSREHSYYTASFGGARQSCVPGRNKEFPFPGGDIQKYPLANFPDLYIMRAERFHVPSSQPRFLSLSSKHTDPKQHFGPILARSTLIFCALLT